MKSNKKIVTIGIGGASCSGKSTLARWLQRILPNSIVLYQDDFFKPQKDVPIDVTTNLVNWDCPEAVDFADFTKTLQQLHKTGGLPTAFKSKERLNVRREIEGLELESLIRKLSLKVNKTLMNVEKVSKENERLVEAQNTIDKISGSSGHSEHKDNEWCFVIVDGFLLYQNVQVIKELDIKLFVRADYETLKKRRKERNSYVTLEGHWIDPPNYFDNIVWPEYIKSHSHLLSGHREIGFTVNDLLVLESDNRQRIKENLEKVVTMTLKFIEKRSIYDGIGSSNDKFEEGINATLNNSISVVVEGNRNEEESNNKPNNEVLVYS